MSKHAYTRGPWEWTFRDFGGVMLQTPDRGKLVVMGFARKGMNSAEPLFAVMDDDQPRGRRGGILCSASELAKEHGDLTHPDAMLIAAAPDLAEALQGLRDGVLGLDQSDEASVAEVEALIAKATAALKRAGVE